MKLTHTTLALFVAVLALPMSAVGQDEEVSSEATSADRALGNTVLASRKTSAELRRDLDKSEAEFYSLYNKLNDDNLYDVRCRYEAPVGTRIKNHVCRPVFLSRAISSGDITRVTNLETNPVIADKMATYRKKMDVLIADNPELQAAVVTFSTARTQYMAQSEKGTNN